LGFDWYRGKPNRQVIYYQTSEQELLDDRERHLGEISFRASKNEFQRRVEIAALLHGQGYRVAQIGRIMRLSEPTIKDLLVRASRIDRKQQTKAT
jgi:hypothetical protein